MGRVREVLKLRYAQRVLLERSQIRFRAVSSILYFMVRATVLMCGKLESALEIGMSGCTVDNLGKYVPAPSKQEITIRLYDI